MPKTLKSTIHTLVSKTILEGGARGKTYIRQNNWKCLNAYCFKDCPLTICLDEIFKKGSVNLC